MVRSNFIASLWAMMLRIKRRIRRKNKDLKEYRGIARERLRLMRQLRENLLENLRNLIDVKLKNEEISHREQRKAHLGRVWLLHRKMLRMMQRKHQKQKKKMKMLQKEESVLNERLRMLRKRLKIKPNRQRIISKCFHIFRKMFRKSQKESILEELPIMKAGSMDKEVQELWDFLLGNSKFKPKKEKQRRKPKRKGHQHDTHPFNAFWTKEVLQRHVKSLSAKERKLKSDLFNWEVPMKTKRVRFKARNYRLTNAKAIEANRMPSGFQIGVIQHQIDNILKDFNITKMAVRRRLYRKLKKKQWKLKLKPKESSVIELPVDWVNKSGKVKYKGLELHGEAQNQAQVQDMEETEADSKKSRPFKRKRKLSKLVPDFEITGPISRRGSPKIKRSGKRPLPKKPPAQGRPAQRPPVEERPMQAPPVKGRPVPKRKMAKPYRKQPRGDVKPSSSGALNIRSSKQSQKSPGRASSMMADKHQSRDSLDEMLSKYVTSKTFTRLSSKRPSRSFIGSSTIDVSERDSWATVRESIAETFTRRSRLDSRTSRSSQRFKAAKLNIMQNFNLRKDGQTRRSTRKSTTKLVLTDVSKAMKNRADFIDWFGKVLRHKHPQISEQVLQKESEIEEMQKVESEETAVEVPLPFFRKSSKASVVSMVSDNENVQDASVREDAIAIYGRTIDSPLGNQLEKSYFTGRRTRGSMESRDSDTKSVKGSILKETKTAGDQLMEKLGEEPDPRKREIKMILKGTIVGPSMLDELADKKRVIKTIDAHPMWNDLANVYEQLKNANLPKTTMYSLLREKYLNQVRSIVTEAIQRGTTKVTSNLDMIYENVSPQQESADSLYEEGKMRESEFARLRKERLSRIFTDSKDTMTDSRHRKQPAPMYSMEVLQRMLDDHEERYSYRFLKTILDAHARYFSTSGYWRKKELASLVGKSRVKRPKRKAKKMRGVSNTERLFYEPRRTCRERRADDEDCYDCDCPPECGSSPDKCVSCGLDLSPLASCCTPSSYRLGLSATELGACARNQQVLQATADICEVCGLVHGPHTLCPVLDLAAAGDGVRLQQQLHLLKFYAKEQEREREGAAAALRCGSGSGSWGSYPTVSSAAECRCDSIAAAAATAAAAAAAACGK